VYRLQHLVALARDYASHDDLRRVSNDLEAARERLAYKANQYVNLGGGAGCQTFDGIIVAAYTDTTPQERKQPAPILPGVYRTCGHCGRTQKGRDCAFCGRRTES
jgi:hypothetical protein